MTRGSRFLAALEMTLGRARKLELWKPEVLMARLTLSRTANEGFLNFRLGLQPHLSAFHLNRIFHGLAAVLFADLFGFFLHE
jgi:hypothetical protein